MQCGRTLSSAAGSEENHPGSEKRTRRPREESSIYRDSASAWIPVYRCCERGTWAPPEVLTPPSARLGDDNERILHDVLEMKDDQIAKLYADGVLVRDLQLGQ